MTPVTPQVVVVPPSAPHSPNTPAKARQAPRKGRSESTPGPCCHCGATSSPQWRKGPKGKPVLCNACGIRFLRTRTLGKAQVGHALVRKEMGDTHCDLTATSCCTICVTHKLLHTLRLTVSLD